MAKIIKEALTKEQLIEKMSESKAKLEDLVSKFNNEESATEAAKLKAEIAKEKAQYNEYAQSLALNACLEKDNPTAEACKVSQYDGLSVKSTTHENGSVTLSIEPARPLLDLTRFDKNVIASWRYKAELLCLFQTKQSAAEINKTDKEYQADLEGFFKLSEEARNAPKASKRSTTTIIKEVVSSMIGEEGGKMVVAADVNKFIAGFTKDNEKERDEIKVAGYRQTVKLLTDICHRILTNSQYHIRTKQLTKEGREWQERHIAALRAPKPAVIKEKTK